MRTVNGGVESMVRCNYDRVFFGVCAAIGKRTGLHKWLIRAAAIFLFCTVMVPTIVMYGILTLCIPVKK